MYIGDIGLLNKSWNIIHMVDDRHPQAYKALHTKGIPTIALPYLDCDVWRQCGETLKDRLQTLQNKTARTIAKL